MWVYSSARRFQVEGIVVTTWRYVLNYLTVTFLGKPVTKGVSGRSALNTLPERRGLND